MLTAITQPNAVRAKRTDLASVPARFGSAATNTAKKGASSIAHLGSAKWLQGYIGAINTDVRMGGLSLEDMAGRLLTLIGIYIPQGYFAVHDNKHPWETNGRNAVVWLMTLGLTSLTKSENYGVNTILLNPIMQQKGAAVRELPFKKRFNLPSLKPLVDWARMDVDYLDIIKGAGIELSAAEKEGAAQGKKALWAASWLDANKVEKIQNHYKELLAKEAAGKEALTATEQQLKKAIPQFFKRINLFNLASTGIITAATVYFIGGVAMQIVNRVFTPLDKEPGGAKSGKTPARPAAQFRSSQLYGPPPYNRPYSPQSTPTMPPYGYARRYGQPNGHGGLN